jgi:hypothetical protein
MNDGSIIPITDEQAKLGQDIVEVIKSTGSYLADILGDLPKDTIGYLFGDRIKEMRAERLEKMVTRSREILEESGVSEPVRPNLKLVLPLLGEAADEDDDELQDLWARLLAATMNPDKLKGYGREFVEAAKKLDPPDARPMIHVAKNNAGRIVKNGVGDVANHLRTSFDEVSVSIRNLEKLGFLVDVNMQLWTSPFGRQFLRAVTNVFD